MINNKYTLAPNVVLIQPNRELVSMYILKYSFESYIVRQFAADTAKRHWECKK